MSSSLHLAVMMNHSISWSLDRLLRWSLHGLGLLTIAYLLFGQAHAATPNTLGDAVALYRAKNYTGAHALLLPITQADEVSITTAKAWYYRALAAVQLNRLDEARSAYKHVLAMAPALPVSDDVNALSRLASEGLALVGGDSALDTPPVPSSGQALTNTGNQQADVTDLQRQLELQQMMMLMSSMNANNNGNNAGGMGNMGGMPPWALMGGMNGQGKLDPQTMSTLMMQQMMGNGLGILGNSNNDN